MNIMSLMMLLLGLIGAAYPCTNILVTKGASADGSAFVSHSDDGSLTDQRVIYVPARDYPPGSKRAVYFDDVAFGGAQQRYVGSNRGPGYEDPSLPSSKPIGFIDQVAHTYAYLDGNYGIMNEHQLMIGEATNGTKFEPQPKENERIFFSSELTRVALERCKTASEAVNLIGKLIDQYGFYGPGEALFLADPQEGWLMEICAGTSDASKGLWVAKKIPDGEVCVFANEFRIREVDPKDTSMRFSPNLFAELERSGWWEPKKGKLDWLKAVSYGELNHPYYSLRRVWRITQRLQPSHQYSPWVEDGFTKEYPISFRPDQKVKIEDVFALHRDHYEGTPFDLTKTLAAGPFGCPYRFTGPYDGSSEHISEDHTMWGAWERAISVFNVGYIYVNQARGHLPDPIGGVCWIGPDKPYLTCFAPFYVGGIKNLPKPYQTCNLLKFDRNSAWWTFESVSNLAGLKFSYMKQDIIEKQQKIEKQELLDIPKMDAQALSLFQKNPAQAIDFLNDYCMKNSASVLSAWHELFDFLLMKYSDGYVNVPKFSDGVGYPKEWLEGVGYSKGPIKYKK